MSYANVVMYMRTLPDYSAKKGKDKDGKKPQEKINADDPANRAKVDAILFGKDNG